jgi:hypothetical protein
MGLQFLGFQLTDVCRDGGEAVFPSRLARTRTTELEAAHEETEAVAGTAVAACARAVWPRSTSQIAAIKPRVVRPRPYIYWLVQPVVPEGRSAALICAGAPV